MARTYRQMANTLGVVWILSAALPAPVAAQSAPPTCYPQCRPGYLCSPQGQCVSACNPPCVEGQQCTAQGQCISACNPACPPGLQCRTDGSCVNPAGVAVPAEGQPTQTPAPPAAQPQPGYAPPQTAPQGYAQPAPGQPQPPPPGQPQPPPPGQPQPAYPGQPQPAYPGQPQPAYPGQPQPAYPGQPGGPTGPAPSPGWAHGAGVFGIVASAVVLGGVVGSIVLNGEEGDSARLVGALTTLAFAVSVPIVAVGGGSARRSPGVRGSPVLRVIGWIGYGLTLADAVALIVVSFEDEVSSAHIASVGALAIASELLFALDAFRCASEASALAAASQPSTKRFRLTPSLALARDGERLVPTLGVAGRF